MNTFLALLSGHIPAVVVLVIGYVLLTVEIYVPGFGLPGITGILLVGVAIAMMQPSFTQALALVIITLAFVGLMIFIAMRSFKKGRLNRSELVLKEKVIDKEQNDSLDCYLGKNGMTVTALRPSGFALIEGERLSVVSKGEFIEKGTEIRVTAVEGTGIIVESVH